MLALLSSCFMLAVKIFIVMVMFVGVTSAVSFIIAFVRFMIDAVTVRTKKGGNKHNE